LSPNPVQLPSPNQLKRRIILKHAKNKTEYKLKENLVLDEISSKEDQDDRIYGKLL
jgi:hypothetical protein